MCLGADNRFLVKVVGNNSVATVTSGTSYRKRNHGS